jgi:hypothetical protein
MHTYTHTRREGKGKGLSRDERRRLAEAGRKAARSDVVRSLAAEVSGAPEEERYALPGMDRCTFALLCAACCVRYQMHCRAWTGAQLRCCVLLAVCMTICTPIVLKLACPAVLIQPCSVQLLRKLFCLRAQ